MSSLFMKKIWKIFDLFFKNDIILSIIYRVLLGSTSALQAGGRGFKSLITHH